MANNKRLLISIFLIAFIVRLAVAIFYLNFDSHALTIHKPFLPFREGSNAIWRVIGDRDNYNTTANNILVYGTLGQTYGRPPLYPIYLAICYFFIGFNIFAFFIPQITIASVNGILIFFLAKRMFDNKTGTMASLFYAFNPHFMLFSIQLYVETLYFFLILSFFSMSKIAF